jgi:hypothetical protein
VEGRRNVEAVGVDPVAAAQLVAHLLDGVRGVAVDVAPGVGGLPGDADLLGAGAVPPLVAADARKRLARYRPLAVHALVQLAGLLLAVRLGVAHRLLAGAHHPLGQ